MVNELVWSTSLGALNICYFAQSRVNISIDYRLQLDNILLVYVDFSLEMHLLALNDWK